MCTYVKGVNTVMTAEIVRGENMLYQPYVGRFREEVINDIKRECRLRVDRSAFESLPRVPWACEEPHQVTRTVKYPLKHNGDTQTPAISRDQEQVSRFP